MLDKKTRRPRGENMGSTPATDIFDFEMFDRYQKKYHHENRWVFAGEKYRDGTVSGNLYFTNVIVKTETGEVCDINTGTVPEGSLGESGDYYRIIENKNSAHCSEAIFPEAINDLISNVKNQISEREKKLTPDQIFYAFDLEKGGKSEHLFIEHNNDRNDFMKLQTMKNDKNNNFY